MRVGTFDYEFFMKHTDIVRDILSIHVSRGSDSRVWGNSFSGLLTSRMAYDFLRSPNPRFAFFITLTLSRWITFLLIALLLATRCQFSKQVGCLWRSAIIMAFWSIWHVRNRVVFDDIQPSVQRCLAVVTAAIKETNQTALGHFDGSVRELLILSHLGISGRPQPPSSTTIIRWKPPQASWHKFNVDGGAPSSPGPIFAGAIFRNSRGFFVTAFTNAVGWGFPLEAELAAILFAFDYGWHSLWVESDSILAIQILQNHIQIIPWRL
ncbi:hypothetical protein ACS0TY_003495 [Phlomoides rotata]